MHRQINPKTKEAYNSNNHDLSHHPFFIKYNSSHPEAFEQSKKTLERAYEIQENGSSQFGSQMLEDLEKILELESNHIKELEQTAIDIAHDVWRVPKSMLHVKITGMKKLQNSLKKPEVKEWQLEKEEELDPELQKHVDHRVMLRTFAQGYAVNQSHSIFHMASERINSIDPRLIQMYKRFSISSTHQYWIADIEAAMSASMLGKTQARPDGIYAEGVCFPTLLHEIVKGIVIYVAGSKHLVKNKELEEKSLETKSIIVKNADKFNYEPWQIMMGPLVVKKLNEILMNIKKEKGITIRNETFMATLGQMDPNEAQDLITSIMEMPEIAMDLIVDEVQKAQNQ